MTAFTYFEVVEDTKDWTTPELPGEYIWTKHIANCRSIKTAQNICLTGQNNHAGIEGTISCFGIRHHTIFFEEE